MALVSERTVRCHSPEEGVVSDTGVTAKPAPAGWSNRKREVPGRAALRTPLFPLAALVALALSAASPLSSAEPPDAAGGGKPLDLDEVVAAALEENPDLRAMRAEWKSMEEVPEEARALPNPMLGLSGMGPLGDGFPSAEEKRIELEQSFPWFGKRGLRGAVAEKEADASRGDYETEARDLVFEVKEAYFDLFAVQHVIAIARAEGDVLARMLEIANAKYATGEVGQADVLKAQTEITMWKARLLELEAREGVAGARLNRLMNRAPESPLGPAATTPAEVESKLEAMLGTDIDSDDQALRDLAEKSRPEIARARARIERDELERDLMKKESLPDYAIGVEYRNIEGADDMAMLRFAIDLPIWRGKVRAGVREAEKSLDASRAELEAAERETALDVWSAHIEWDTARRTHELYTKALLPQAEARLRASEAGYRTGTVDFLDLLESERFYLAARVEAAMAEGEVGGKLARLERATGAGRIEDAPREE
jgi:outer membrane protein TolC